jgi:hypothetical protein
MLACFSMAVFSKILMAFYTYNEIIYTTSIQPSFMPEGDPSLSTSFVVSREAVYKKLSSLNSTKAQGPDGVPAWLLKENADCLVDPTYNLNCSFPEGCLPPSWNRADHIPVPKE